MADHVKEHTGLFFWLGPDGSLWRGNCSRLERITRKRPESDAFHRWLEAEPPDALKWIRKKWGIKNPPPWLICHQMGKPYELRQQKISTSSAAFKAD